MFRIVKKWVLFCLELDKKGGYIIMNQEIELKKINVSALFNQEQRHHTTPIKEKTNQKKTDKIKTSNTLKKIQHHFTSIIPASMEY